MSLKVLPFYAEEVECLDDALRHRRSARLIWLEILLNPELDWTTLAHDPRLHEAFQKACRWFTRYRRLVTSFIPQLDLPRDDGPIDARDRRVFVEALRFVSTHRT